MIRLITIGHGPTHARCKVELKGIPPTPNGRLIGRVHRTVHTPNRIAGRHPRKQITTLSPNIARFAVGLPINIATAPSASARILVTR